MDSSDRHAVIIKNKMLICLFCIFAVSVLVYAVTTINKAEAAERGALSSSPGYMRQMENYIHEVEKYELKQKRRNKQELEESLITHSVKKGETLSLIAREYDTDITTLLKVNDNIDNPHKLAIGQEIEVLTIDGAVHRVKEGEGVKSIAERYNVDPEEVISFNILEDEGNSLSEGEKLVLPGGEFPEAKKEQARSHLIASRRHVPDRSTSASGTGSAPGFNWPVRGEITSSFGWRNGTFHHGIDIASPEGSEVKAAYKGVVDFTGHLSGYGLTLILDHGGGWSTLYAHNKEVLVSTGVKVASGQAIARLGSTGNATGPHVHFEIMKNEEKLDPLQFLP